MHIKETYSTNTLLKEALASPMKWTELMREPLPHIRTDYQTAGRGQMGNSWESERGKNILLSILIQKPDIRVEEQFVLSMLFPLAVIEAVEQMTGLKGLKIKWSNDIYFEESKLAGILIENSLNAGLIQSAILGIGLNVNQTEWHSDAPNPISLKQITGRDWDVQLLTDSILNNLSQRLRNIDKIELKQSYLQHLLRYGEWKRFADFNGEFEAQIVDVDSFGRLVLNDRNGKTRVYNFKEIKYLFN